MKQTVGICVGASTISFVTLEESNSQISIIDSYRINHNGYPSETLTREIEKYQGLPCVITGRKFRKLVTLPTISEPEATELAYNYLYPECHHSAIVSLGSETFIMYVLTSGGKIANVISKNQCASGTGEFFMQQIGRMNLSIDETVTIAQDATPYKVSGRCSVFCKSDCTHALNKGVPKSEVAAGLAKMISEKIEELLAKIPHKNALLIGGVTHNTTVMKYVKSAFPTAEIPATAGSFEALGAGIYAMEHNIQAVEKFEDIINHHISSFAFHKSIQEYTQSVEFKTELHRSAREGEECILGLDVGSTTTKAVLIATSDSRILASVYLYTNGDPIGASRECYRKLSEQVPASVNIIGLGTTGSGRHIAGLHALTDNILNEIIAHANAAVYFDPEVDTIFEIGGQDAKYTYLINKVPADYAMNEACSAGTGSFIEESVKESFGIKVQEIENIALQAERPPNFSDQCAAFISSDIKTALHENITRENIVAGLVYSICMNYVNRVKGNRTIGKKIFMQGGVCYNKAIPIAMAGLTGQNIIVPPDPGLMGAFGVALSVKEKIDLGLSERKEFDLNELTNREVTYHKPFICEGTKEKCDRKCSINVIKVEGKRYPFGGACNKYYDLKVSGKFDYEHYDAIKTRQAIIFNQESIEQNGTEKRKTVGINLSFNAYTLYPLYYHFFTRLGFELVLPDYADPEGMERETASMCYPAQLSLGMFQNLLDKNTDYIFAPSIYEMFVSKDEEFRLDFNCSCVFVSGEPMYLKQTFKEYDFSKRYISPNLNFARGFEFELPRFIETAEKMGVKDKQKISSAYKYAIEMWEKANEDIKAEGKRIFKELEQNPDDFAMVMVGRPYNAFAEEANKGIPRKFASRGVRIIPYEMLDFETETVDDEMYWEGGKRILKAAKIIERHPQLFAVYISNFSCGPDSMILSTFRDIMGKKPSLTLELDGHTADAGINTRIEAALDIIANYRKLQAQSIQVKESTFKIANMEFGDKMSYFVKATGEKIPLNDPSVEVLIPSMGDLAAPLFAAVFRSLGINAKALPESNTEILKYGHSVASGKECLPLLLLAGSLLDYLYNRYDGEKNVAYFVVQGAGNCRLGQYPVFLRNMLQRLKIENTALMVLMNEDGFAGFGSDFALRGIQALIASDVIDDIRSAIMAYSVNPEQSLEIFYEEYAKVEQAMASEPKRFYKALANFSEAISRKVKSRVPVDEFKYVALLGEIYVRRDGFAHKWLNKRFAGEGFVIKDAYISEWIKYVDYLIDIDLLEPEKSIKKKIERNIRSYFTKNAEKKIKRILAKTGFYKYSDTKIKEPLEHSKTFIPLEFKGEPGLTIGTALYEGLEKYCGIINVGPFGCMPTRFTEAIAAHNMNTDVKSQIRRMNEPKFQLSKVFNGHTNIPFLTIESDGNAFPQVIEARIETFTMQCKRTSELMSLASNGKNH